MSSDSYRNTNRNPYFSAISRLLPRPHHAGSDTIETSENIKDDDPINLSLRLALVRLRNRRPTQRPSSWGPSVSALCREAGVARSTFYGHYHTVDDVLSDLEDRMVSDLLSLNAPSMDKSTGSTFINSTARYVRQHRSQFQSLLVSQPDWRFINLWKTAIKYHFWQRLFGPRHAVIQPKQQPLTQQVHPIGNRGLVLETVASTVVSGFAYLLKQPDTTSWADLGTLVEMSLSSLDTVR